MFNAIVDGWVVMSCAGARVFVCVWGGGASCSVQCSNVLRTLLLLLLLGVCE